MRGYMDARELLELVKSGSLMSGTIDTGYRVTKGGQVVRAPAANVWAGIWLNISHFPGQGIRISLTARAPRVELPLNERFDWKGRVLHYDLTEAELDDLPKAAMAFGKVVGLLLKISDKEVQNEQYNTR